MDSPNTIFLPGFNLSNFVRNKTLMDAGYKPPMPMTTGTTIVGVIFKDGVVLGSDTRTTEGNTVCDKDSRKIYRLADNIYCCGAGLGADTANITAILASELKLLSLDTGRECQVISAVTIFKRKVYPTRGQLNTVLIVGGVDKTGSHLYTVYPHGSSDVLQFTAVGSGQAAAISALEEGWKPGMSEQDAKLLVGNAISAGVFNDLHSGSSVDLCVVRRENSEYIRTLKKCGTPRKKAVPVEFMPGTTEVLETTVKYFE